jgi:hypothetical protein
LIGSMAWAPRPDWLFTQWGNQPHSDNACVAMGLVGTPVQAPSNKPKARAGMHRVRIFKLMGWNLSYYSNSQNVPKRNISLIYCRCS